MSGLVDDTVKLKLSLPGPGEWVPAAMILILLVSAFTISLGLRGYRLSTVSLMDPAGVIQVTAWDIFNDRSFRENEFPLWNPYTGLGQPHIAAMQPAPFFPLKFFAYLFGGLAGRDLYLFLRLWLMGYGAFLLFRSIGIRFGGAMFGAISFGFGGYSLWFLNMVDMNNQVLTPFITLVFARFSERWSPRIHLLAAALVAANVLGGHPEGLFVSLLFSGLFAVYWAGPGRIVKTAARIMAAGLTGFLTASLVIAPFAEYYPRSWSFHFPGMGFIHLWARALISIFSPLFYPIAFKSGWELLPGINAISLWQIFHQTYSVMTLKWGFPYLGFCAGIFAMIGIFRFKRLPRAGAFFVAFFLFAAGLSMGVFPFRLLAFIPPFNLMNNAKFYFCEITFSLCALAGMCADKTLRRGIKSSLAVMAILVIELSVSSLTVKPYVPVDWDRSMKAPWAAGLDLSSSGYRFQAGGYFLFPPNFGVAKGFSDIRSSDALFPIEYFRWLNDANGTSADEAIYDFYPRYFTRLNKKGLSSDAAKLMGVKYYVDEVPDDTLVGFQPIKKNGFYLYERPDVCPRLFEWDNNIGGCGAAVTFERINAEKIEADIIKPMNVLMFNELRYPGWRAAMSGAEIKPVRLDVPLQAYDVAGKTGDLVIAYAPVSFRVGLWVSLSTCVFAVAAAFTRKSGTA